MTVEGAKKQNRRRCHQSMQRTERSDDSPMRQAGD